MHLVIADQQAATRSALQMLLREEPDLWVVGEAADSEALMAQVVAHGPDCVLIEWRLPGRHMVDLIPTLHGRNRRPRVIVLSGRPELEETALAAGADAFFNMGDPPRLLLALLRAFDQDPQKGA